MDVGSSYLPGEVIAAFLCAQLEDAQAITKKRLDIWQKYHESLEELERRGYLRRPIISADCSHNAHMYYILLNSLHERTLVIQKLATLEINSVFHYVPLHSSPAGLKYGRLHGSLKHTEDLANRVLRLPMWLAVEDHIPNVVMSLTDALSN